MNSFTKIYSIDSSIQTLKELMEENKHIIHSSELWDINVTINLLKDKQNKLKRELIRRK